MFVIGELKKIKFSLDLVVTEWQDNFFISYIFFLWRCDPTRVMASSFLMFLDHTQRRTTVGRTPLDE